MDGMGGGKWGHVKLGIQIGVPPSTMKFMDA